MNSTKINGKIRLLEGTASDHKKQMAEDIRKGLCADTKRIPSVYFYDETGSRYFEQICALDEYYPTRSETEILSQVSHHIVKSAGKDARIIELGSGNSSKTRLILEAFLRENNACEYCPIDVSKEILHDSAIELTSDYPDLKVTAVAPSVRRRFGRTS